MKGFQVLFQEMNDLSYLLKKTTFKEKIFYVCLKEKNLIFTATI